MKRAHLLPIAATEQDLDLFAMTAPGSPRPGEVIWFAGNEVQRFSSFDEYFLAMQDLNRRECIALDAAQAGCLPANDE